MSVSAKEFAIKAHGSQRYGNGPYRNHLQDIVQVLADFGYKDEWVSAGWLYGTLRYTSVERCELRALFGYHVTSLVESCTPLGATRARRNKVIYENIAFYPQGAILKVASRIANVEACTPASEHFAKYMDEHQDFNNHVVRLAPYSMKRRLDKEMDIRRSVMFA